MMRQILPLALLIIVCIWFPSFIFVSLSILTLAVIYELCCSWDWRLSRTRRHNREQARSDRRKRRVQRALAKRFPKATVVKGEFVNEREIERG